MAVKESVHQDLSLIFFNLYCAHASAFVFVCYVFVQCMSSVGWCESLCRIHVKCRPIFSCCYCCSCGFTNRDICDVIKEFSFID